MFRFIIQTLIMAALAFMVYLMAEALPRISDEEVDAIKIKRSTRLMGYIEKVDNVLKSFLEKFLRKSKVWLLQLNNFIEKKLSKFKKDPAKTAVLPTEEGKRE